MGQSKNQRNEDESNRMSEREAQLNRVLLNARKYIKALEARIAELEKITTKQGDDDN